MKDMAVGKEMKVGCWDAGQVWERVRSQCTSSQRPWFFCQTGSSSPCLLSKWLQVISKWDIKYTLFMTKHQQKANLCLFLLQRWSCRCFLFLALQFLLLVAEIWGGWRKRIMETHACPVVNLALPSLPTDVQLENGFSALVADNAQNSIQAWAT